MRIPLLLALCLTVLPLLSLAQDRTVSGRVTDAAGNVLPGVNISILNTSAGTITDIEGNYSLQVPADATVLVFSYIGYVRIEEPLNGRSRIDIALLEDTQQLEEIVVTGYSTQKKRDIIGSISSLSPETIKDMPIVGLDQALQGQMAGVAVTQSSGTPGGGIMVRVRGNSSISSSNRPLFIVDGIPVRDGGLTTRSFGGQGDNALAMLNPNDIESIEVLKDASAKAIYGSRAANGVVLITTKRGQSNARMTFDFDMQRGLVDLTKKLDLLNAGELLELQRESLRNAGEDPDGAGRPGITDGVDTDWIDAVTRQALLQQYQISGSGGSERTRVFLSAAYRDEEGVMLNNRFQRLTGTLNVDHDATSRLNIGVNLNISRTLNKRVKGDNFLDGVYSAAITSLPYFQPYDEDGRLYAPGDLGYAGFPNFNPVAQALEPRFDTYATRLLGGVSLRYQFSPKLVFNSRFSMDYITTIEDQYEPTTTAIGGFLVSVGQQGYGVYSSTEGSNFLNSNVLNYNTSFSGGHDLGVLVGTELISRITRDASVSGILFPSDDFTYLVSAGIVNQGSSNRVNSGLLSFFTEWNYKYKDKYLVSVSGRFDGSSRFGQDNKFGFFPAISLGWRLSEEAFIKQFAFIDDFKLRASFGLTGNERIGNFQFLGTWAAVNAYNGVPAIAPATLANPDLGWEQNQELNAGFDIAFLEGRIQTVVDYYYNRTNNLLLSETLPLTTGFGSVLGNLGEITNEGIEFSINSVNIDRALKWSTNFNISRNVNTVRKLATDEPQFSGYQTFTNSTHIVTPGAPLGTFWGLRFLGVDPATGDAIYFDRNNDGQITAEDGTIIGSAQPDFFGGLTNTLTYRNFDFSFFFQFSYGNEMINFSNTSLLNSGADIANNQSREALKRWRQPGDISSVPKYEFGNTDNSRFSSRFVEDASYLRLKNVSLGYRVPERLLGRFLVRSARIYASATNLLTFSPYTGADPEVNSLDGSTVAQGLDLYTFPQVRTLLLGLTIGF
jgi:TonB-dependent starch-binding outer membrane protein SusC